MNETEPYYARYDIRYRKVRELGLLAFKAEECAEVDRRLLDAFLDWHDDIKAAESVIEFGCGDGFLAVHSVKKGYRVVAFDYSAAAIQGCRGLAERENVTVDFRTGNVLGIEWAADQSFDLGISNNVLQMMGTTEDREQCVAEMHRVLKLGAFLYLNVPSNTEVPEQMSSLEEHRKHREFMCDLRGTVEVDDGEQEVLWPEVASWGPNVYSAGPYFRDRGFDLRYIHWEHQKGYGHGLTMYLQRR